MRARSWFRRLWPRRRRDSAANAADRLPAHRLAGAAKSSPRGHGTPPGPSYGLLAIRAWQYNAQQEHSHRIAGPLKLHLAPPRLDRPALGLAFQTALLRTQGRLGRAPGLFGLGGIGNKSGQPLEGMGAVLLLGTVLLGLDDHHALGGDAAVAQRQQTLLVERRQGRGLTVETQVHGTGDLVDVLPTGALRTDGGQLDFSVGQVDAVGNNQHGKGLRQKGQSGYTQARLEEIAVTVSFPSRRAHGGEN